MGRKWICIGLNFFAGIARVLEALKGYYKMLCMLGNAEVANANSLCVTCFMTALSMLWLTDVRAKAGFPAIV